MGQPLYGIIFHQARVAYGCSGICRHIWIHDEEEEEILVCCFRVDYFLLVWFASFALVHGSIPLCCQTLQSTSSRRV